MNHSPNPMSRFVAHRKSRATMSVPEPRGRTVLEVFDLSATTASPYFTPRIAHPLRHPFCRSPRIPRKGPRARYSPASGISPAVGNSPAVGDSPVVGDSPACVEKRPLRGPVFLLDGRTLPEAGKHSPFPSIDSRQLSPGWVTATKGVLPVSSAAHPVWPGPHPGSSRAFPVSPTALPVSPATTSTTGKSNACLSTNDGVTELSHGGGGTPRRGGPAKLQQQQLDSISEEKGDSPRSRGSRESRGSRGSLQGSKDLTPVDLIHRREGAKTNRIQNPGVKEVGKKSRRSVSGPNRRKSSVDVIRDGKAVSDTLTRFSVLRAISPDDGQDESAESEDNPLKAPREGSSEVATSRCSKVGRGVERDREHRTTVEVYLPRVDLGSPSSDNEDDDD